MSATVRNLLRAFPFVLLGAVCCAAQSAPVARTLPVSQNASHQVQTNYGKLPLSFEANVGQTDPQVKFLAHGSGYSLFLTSGQMVLSLRASSITKPDANAEPANPATRQKPRPTSPIASTNAVIRINMVAANPAPKATGEDLQPGKVNYFIGKDPSKWQRNVPLYRQVRYENVYPGIDVVYYGNQSRVEHDFVVNPGADPSKIQLDVQGADRLSVASNGDLILHKSTDEVRLQAPVVYQPFHGLKVSVDGQYKIQNSTRVSFALGQYDKTLPLVIDPVLVYGTFLGGLADDQAVGIAVDSDGSAYVAGSTQSTNFPLASQNGPMPSGQSLFVAKLDVSGSSLVYADYIGGTSYNQAAAMALDTSNQVFVTGYTSSGDFPVVNALQSESAGGNEGFIAQVSADGSSLVYSTYLGGNSDDYPQSIALDPDGNIYVAGYTYSQNYPTVKAFQSSAQPNQQEQYGFYGFVSKLAADGSALAYSTYLGGNTVVVQNCYYGPCWPSPYNYINGIAVDGSGSAYVAGTTNTYNFPVTEGAYQISNATTGDQQVAFIGKFDAAGNQVYATYLNAGENAYWTGVNGISVDSQGAAYVIGQTYPWGQTFPITETHLCDPSESSCTYGYIFKLDPTGAFPVYSTFLAANVDVNPQSLTLDANGDVFVLSSSGGGDPEFLVNPIENFTNQADLFIQEIDPTGGSVLFSTWLGGYGYDQPGGIALDSTGAIYVTGYTSSTDFPVSAAALQNTLGGNADVFVSKIGPAVQPAVALSPSLIQFSIRPVGSVSQPNTSLLRNMGSGPLSITNLTITGDFAETDNCGTGVAAAGSCTFTVTFNPTQPGPRYGSIMIEDDAAGSPHFINLVGNGATAVANLSTASLAFPSLQINQTSSAQTVTLTNNGNATMVISDISITGDYAQTNNCPGSLGIGSSCTFQVTFTPTQGGERDGSLTITDNAPGSPRSIALTGSGYVTTATVSPSSLAFGNQALASTSSAQSIVITNTGANPITVSAVTTTGDFAQTNNCTTTPVAVEGTCTINVTFSPTLGGSRLGTLTVNDNAEGNPHVVTLSGTGMAGVASLSSSSLVFSAQTVGTSAAVQTITVTNTGNGNLTFASIQATGDFSQTNNCTSVAAEGSCTIQVSFTPTSSGNRTGTLTLTDSAATSPQLVSLSGSGIDFSMPASGGTASVTAGGTATYQVSVGAVGGNFSSAVNLTCAGVPAFSTCTVNPTSVTPGSNASSVTVTIKTAGTTAKLAAPADRNSPMLAWIMLPPGLGLFGLCISGRQRRQRMAMLMLLFMVASLTLITVGCGGSSTPTQTVTPKGNATPSGAYTVLVIGTSGSVQHFSSLTLTVK